MKFHQYLRELRIGKNISKTELSKALKVSFSFISNIESGYSKPPSKERCIQIADFLNLKQDEKDKLIKLAILERANKEVKETIEDYFFKSHQKDADSKFLKEKDFDKIPLLGGCPASPKMWMLDEVEGWHPILKSMAKGKRLYLLRVKGDSMNRAGIDNDDLVLVDADKQPSNGNIVVIRIDHECTMKRFYKSNDKITLVPDSLNPEHQPTSFDKAHDIQIRGVVEAIYMKKIK